MGDAAGVGSGIRVGKVDGHLAAEAVEDGAEADGDREETGGAHICVVAFGESGFDLLEVTGELLELVFIAGHVRFLDAFHADELVAIDGLGVAELPVVQGGTRDAELFRDFAEAPAIGAENDERAEFWIGFDGRVIEEGGGGRGGFGGWEVFRGDGFHSFGFRIAEGVGHPRGDPGRKIKN